MGKKEQLKEHGRRVADSVYQGYNRRSHNRTYTCPECGRSTNQNRNFLGRRLMICTGSKWLKEYSIGYNVGSVISAIIRDIPGCPLSLGPDLDRFYAVKFYIESRIVELRTETAGVNNEEAIDGFTTLVEQFYHEGMRLHGGVENE